MGLGEREEQQDARGEASGELALEVARETDGLLLKVKPTLPGRGPRAKRFSLALRASLRASNAWSRASSSRFLRSLLTRDFCFRLRRFLGAVSRANVSWTHSGPPASLANVASICSLCIMMEQSHTY